MLTKTTISAIRTLLFLAERAEPGVVSPRALAEALVVSPTYLAKTVGSLVKAGLLRAEKGSRGGVALNLPPARITLQAIYEACQGVVMGDYCTSGADPKSVCSFHQASVELHFAIVGVLSRWTLADLLERPRSARLHSSGHVCVMAGDIVPLLTLTPERPPWG